MSKLKKATADPQPFVVRRSGIQGKGGFALRDIRKGERLIEYVGERISWKDADKRYDDEKMGRHHTFLFSVTRRTVIDAAFGGNDSRFINHSCAPNCEAVDEKNRIFIEAIKPIAKGQELFYDYAYERDRNTTDEDEKLYICLCGSPKCRGTILAPAKKPVVAKHHSAARHPHDGANASLARRRTGKSAGDASKKTREKTSSSSPVNARKTRSTARKPTRAGAEASGEKRGRKTSGRTGSA